MLKLPLCHWSSQLFDLRASSSTDVPVLLLNQPNVLGAQRKQVISIKCERFDHNLRSGKGLIFFNDNNRAKLSGEKEYNEAFAGV